MVTFLFFKYDLYSSTFFDACSFVRPPMSTPFILAPLTICLSSISLAFAIATAAIPAINTKRHALKIIIPVFLFFFINSHLPLIFAYTIYLTFISLLSILNTYLYKIKESKYQLKEIHISSLAFLTLWLFCIPIKYRILQLL